MVGLDFIANMSGSGGVAERLLANNMDPYCLRPYIGYNGRHYQDKVVGIDNKGKAVWKAVLANALASLRKDEWISLDKAVVRAARSELTFLNDLQDAGLTMTVPEGMGKTILQYQAMTDAGAAQLDMDGLGQSTRDRTEFDLRGLPLPLAHADWSFPLREILQSRNFGMPQDTTMIEQDTRKVMELHENLFLGNLSTYTYGGYTVYGFRNYPYRITKTFTLPTSAGWTPDTFVSEILDAIQALTDLFFKGPFALYMSPGWTKYLDNDYAAAYGFRTLRERLKIIEDVKYIRKVDLMPNFEVLLIQMKSNTVRVVNFLETVPLQWESHGGLKINGKILSGKVPMLRANTQLNTGIVHGVAA